MVIASAGGAAWREGPCAVDHGGGLWLAAEAAQGRPQASVSLVRWGRTQAGVVIEEDMPVDAGFVEMSDGEQRFGEPGPGEGAGAVTVVGAVVG